MKRTISNIIINIDNPEQKQEVIYNNPFSSEIEFLDY